MTKKIDAQITVQEEVDRKLIKWPRFSEMLDEKKPILKKDTRILMKYLYSWMYDTYSTNCHGRYSGITRRYFLRHIEVRPYTGSKDDPKEEDIQSAATYSLYRACVLLLMILTETAVNFGMSHVQVELLTTWLLYKEYFDETAELYDLRYQKLINDKLKP